MEADFQRFYHLDLADLWRGELTFRKAAVLAEHLPPEAAIYRQGADDRFWSLETQFLASIIDLLRTQIWLSTDTKKNKQPEPMPRPGDAERNAEKTAAKETEAERKMRVWEARQKAYQARLDQESSADSQLQE